jgi:endonuclease/exonuclease/phosphatase family metal-dependent hydrolase
MSYVSGPTADPFWGNAIFSRYPIVSYENLELPPSDLSIRRGFISALMDLGDGENLHVVAAHFHHSMDPKSPPPEDSAVRQLQSRAVVEFWNEANRTVLFGDFNADPDSPEMEMLRQTELVDLVARIEPPLAPTWPSDDPYVRLDYVWVSPDLKVHGVHVLESTVSDHFPVLGIIGR